MPSVSDDMLRQFSFIASVIATLGVTFTTVLKAKAGLVTGGEIVVREGFIALLVSVFYGTGEQLWHWYHLRLVILALAMLWILVGLVWMLVDIAGAQSKGIRRDPKLRDMPQRHPLEDNA